MKVCVTHFMRFYFRKFTNVHFIIAYVFLEYNIAYLYLYIMCAVVLYSFAKSGMYRKLFVI